VILLRFLRAVYHQPLRRWSGYCGDCLSNDRYCPVHHVRWPGRIQDLSLRGRASHWTLWTLNLIITLAAEELNIYEYNEYNSRSPNVQDKRPRRRQYMGVRCGEGVSPPRFHCGGVWRL